MVEYQSIRNTAKNIRLSLANSLLNEAIERLVDFAELTKNKEIRNGLVIMNANYVNIVNKEISNTSEKIQLEKNNLIVSLLMLTDKIEEELIKLLSADKLISISSEDKKKIKESLWSPISLEDEKLTLAIKQLFLLEMYNRQIHSWNPNEVEINKDYERYLSWINTKRQFSTEEIIDGSWIKITRNGEGSVLLLMEDNSIIEYSIHDPSKNWGGTWKLEQGIIILNIHFNGIEYRQFVVANREIMNHSGHEFALNLRSTSLDYFHIILVKNRNDYW